MTNKNINPVVAWYMSETKEINITVTDFHDSQERSIFKIFVLGLIILCVT